MSWSCTQRPATPPARRGSAERFLIPRRSQPSVQAPVDPLRGWLVGCDGQQDPPFRRQCAQMLVVVGHRQPVLFPDSTEARQFRDQILADLDGGRDQHGAEVNRTVDEQLPPRVPAEDRVFRAVAGCRNIEALPVPVEPVGTQLRAPVATDPGDDDVPRLSQEGLDVAGGGHSLTLPGPPARPAVLSRAKAGGGSWSVLVRPAALLLSQ